MSHRHGSDSSFIGINKGSLKKLAIDRNIETKKNKATGAVYHLRKLTMQTDS